MSIMRIQVPDGIKALIARQVAEGRVASEAEFIVEAAQRFAEDLEAEAELIAVASAGIKDLEAGHFETISGPEDEKALADRTISRLRARLSE
jgi:Arc/MetJ-type ribon-helix-helix transcriptional regulator